MKILKEYINFIVENNQSFIDVYNSYVEEQKPEESADDQKPEDDDMNILVDPYAYYNYPEYSENNNNNEP
tara:strand:- start:69 stop:278 length:210 start_codon:yes stop_codon:yes gene_type:complete